MHVRQRSVVRFGSGGFLQTPRSQRATELEDLHQVVVHSDDLKLLPFVPREEVLNAGKSDDAVLRANK